MTIAAPSSREHSDVGSFDPMQVQRKEVQIGADVIDCQKNLMLSLLNYFTPQTTILTIVPLLTLHDHAAHSRTALLRTQRHPITKEAITECRLWIEVMVLTGASHASLGTEDVCFDLQPGKE